jgi:hypothetical protein
MMSGKTNYVHPASPFFHPLKVKEVGGVKYSYIDIYNFSLSIFHPFTPTPPRDARTRVYVCVYVRGGERGKEGGNRRRQRMSRGGWTGGKSVWVCGDGSVCGKGRRRRATPKRNWRGGRRERVWECVGVGKRKAEMLKAESRKRCVGVSGGRERKA